MYKCFVRTGNDLINFASAAKDFKPRHIFKDLNSYISSSPPGKVCVLAGLRRTGKTTMMQHAILSMSEEIRAKTAFITIIPTDNIYDLRHDLLSLQKRKYRYVFIDEVTFLTDFIEAASMFSDVFAADGMCIVLSGTDSLGFYFTEHNQLFGRSKMIHTTWIPYGEFEDVKSIFGIDNYIKYGGILSPIASDITPFPFKSAKTSDEYVKASIAENIQNSLCHYKDGERFGCLGKLYDDDELIGAIQRVVEDSNHRFLLKVLTAKFKSHDLGLAKRNLLHIRDDGKRDMVSKIIENLDIPAITVDIMQRLKIKNEEQMKNVLRSEHIKELEAYLKAIDVVQECKQKSYGGEQYAPARYLIVQPGLRYSQVQAILDALQRDSKLATLDQDVLDLLKITLDNAVLGKMMEDIVILETAKSYPESAEVFSFALPGGEFDMVVRDWENNVCTAVEVKHSSEIVPEQMSHLCNDEYMACLASLYNKDCEMNRVVIYTGKDFELENGIKYVNIDSYLRKLCDLRNGEDIDPFEIPRCSSPGY